MDTLSLTKEARIYNGLKTISLTSGAGKSGQPLVHGVCSDSCPLSQGYYPTISSSVIPFSSCPQSLPASGSFPMSQLFPSGGQSIGVSASVSVLPMNIQDWFPLGWTSWISLHSICQKIWKIQQWSQDWKRSDFIPVPKKGNAKQRQCQWMFKLPHKLHSFHMLVKYMLKILQVRLQQYVNWKLPDVQPGFWKGRGTRDQITNMHWITEKAREFQKKTSTSASLIMLKPLCGSQQTVENS